MSDVTSQKWLYSPNLDPPVYIGVGMGQFYSLRALQLIYSLAFILLLLASAVGGRLAFEASESSALESQRVARLLQTVELIRGDLYRQLKEVFDYHFLDDKDADREYRDLGHRLEDNFQVLRNLALTHEESHSIEELINAYEIVDLRVKKIMSLSPGTIAHDEKLEILDTELEGEGLNTLEATFTATENLFLVAQTESQLKIKRLIQTALILVILPIVVAAGLLWLARSFLQKAFVQPLAELLNSMSIFGRGHLDHRAKELGAREMLVLQKAINNMADDLNQSREALVRTEKQAALGALVPVMAHNIRNPLAGIRATAQVSNVSELSDETRQSLSDIVDAVDRLETWLHSLLNFLNPLKPVFMDCFLSDCIDNALSLLQLKITEKNIFIERNGWERAVKTKIDAHLMEQAVYGLISNALDASPENAKIIIWMETQAEGVTLSIEDQGDGIPMEATRKGLFPGPTTKSAGSGLGIPFAYKVCDLHEGTLQFAKSKLDGTQVSIWIPFK